jgi:hypothetical protein
MGGNMVYEKPQLIVFDEYLQRADGVICGNGSSPGLNKCKTGGVAFNQCTDGTVVN